MIRFCFLLVLLLPRFAAAGWIELTAEEQIALAMTVVSEAGGEGRIGQIAATKVVLYRSKIAGESVAETLRTPQQFAGYRGGISASRASELVDMLGLVWDVAAGKYGDYGPYTNFRPAGKAPKSWYKQATAVVQIGRHEFFAGLPYKVAARRNAGTMLRNLAASSQKLARIIFPCVKLNTRKLAAR